MTIRKIGAQMQAHARTQNPIWKQKTQQKTYLLIKLLLCHRWNLVGLLYCVHTTFWSSSTACDYLPARDQKKCVRTNEFQTQTDMNRES